jgi:hypothetical protein
MSNMGTSIAPDIRRRRPSPYWAPDRKKIGREISRFKALPGPSRRKKIYFFVNGLRVPDVGMEANQAKPDPRSFAAHFPLGLRMMAVPVLSTNNAGGSRTI